MISVAVIGGGASGMAFAVALKAKKDLILRLPFFEKKSEGAEKRYL